MLITPDEAAAATENDTSELLYDRENTGDTRGMSTSQHTGPVLPPDLRRAYQQKSSVMPSGESTVVPPCGQCHANGAAAPFYDSQVSQDLVIDGPQSQSFTSISEGQFRQIRNQTSHDLHLPISQEETGHVECGVDDLQLTKNLQKAANQLHKDREAERQIGNTIAIQETGEVGKVEDDLQIGKNIQFCNGDEFVLHSDDESQPPEVTEETVETTSEVQLFDRSTNEQQRLINVSVQLQPIVSANDQIQPPQQGHHVASSSDQIQPPQQGHHVASFSDQFQPPQQGHHVASSSGQMQSHSVDVVSNNIEEDRVSLLPLQAETDLQQQDTAGN